MLDPLNSSPTPQPSESFGSVPHTSENFGKVPQPSATFGTVPQAAEDFRTVRQTVSRAENHTLTVREAARRFEAAGVARTERSIVNWCQPVPQGVPRLDAYYEVNERKWFITPESVVRAIAEEQAKAPRQTRPMPDSSDPVRKASEDTRKGAPDTGHDTDHTRALEREIMDLKILNGGKDYVIEQMRKERDGFIQQVFQAHRKVGQLESELKQLAAPKAHIPHRAEAADEGSETVNDSSNFTFR